MRKATKATATWFGIAAGVAGFEHGVFEVLQGNTRPEGVMISSIGPPCVPEEIWNSCEPAMTILPNFLITGILAMILGLAVTLLAIFLLDRKYAGWVMIGLCAALLLFGGGLFPPVIGFVSGAVAMKIHKPFSKEKSGGFRRFMAKLWPWPLVIFLVWVFGQWVVGYLNNAFMTQAMYLGVVLILACLPLSAFSAYSYDLGKHLEAGESG